MLLVSSPGRISFGIETEAGRSKCGYGLCMGESGIGRIRDSMKDVNSFFGEGGRVLLKTSSIFFKAPVRAR